jgi:ATP-dependent DNA ligase
VRARPDLDARWHGLDHRFPAIAEAVRGLSADEPLIDGEAVVFRHDGRIAFAALLTKRGGAQATLVAFDLLRFEGEDESRAMLDAKPKRLPDGPRLRPSRTLDP